MTDEICGMRAGMCVCTLPPHRASDVHHCTTDDCGGLWLDDAEGTFAIFRMPKTKVLFNPPLTNGDASSHKQFCDAIETGMLKDPLTLLYEALGGNVE